MSDDNEEQGRPELKPARPDAVSEGSARPSYMPRMPWRWIILGTAALVALFGGYYMRRQQRAEALRDQMLTLHESRLGEVASRYMRFRERIETLIVEAAEGGEPETFVDPRLRMSTLRNRDGLYVRLPIEHARDRSRVGPVARGVQPDAITRCMGISPMLVSGLYEKGDFLTPDWVEALRSEDDMMELRVLDDQLGRHVQVDVPVVLTMMQAEWLMLVLQQGEDRTDHPVDVFVWDLRHDRQLLRARVQARGMLLPVRLRFEGAGNDEGARPVRAGGAQDCSIASQIRELITRDGGGVEIESGDQLLEARGRERASASEAERADTAPDAP